MDESSAQPALIIESLSHNFGDVQALDDVSLNVQPGTFTALLGVNGAGKSTLFNLITRLYSNRTGQIIVCGHNMGSAARSALAKLGVVFQSRSLDGALTVAQNIEYQGALQGIGRAESMKRGTELLARVRMEDALAKKVATLSGGQARRVEIARALLHRPALLLCDEPTVGLDVKSRTEIVADMHALAAEEGTGILWATHLIDEIEPDDPVVVLHKGRVLAANTARVISDGQDLSDAFLALTGSTA